MTYGNSTHLGNDVPRPGSDLIPDLMNGVVFVRGDRYDISPLDLAIISDTGLAVNTIPEPGSFFMCWSIGSCWTNHGEAERVKYQKTRTNLIINK